MKKNCHNCKYLEWIDDDSEVSNNSGWVCNKKKYSEAHLQRLENPVYRMVSKRCCEIDIISKINSAILTAPQGTGREK